MNGYNSTIKSYAYAFLLVGILHIDACLLIYLLHHQVELRIPAAVYVSQIASTGFQIWRHMTTRWPCCWSMFQVQLPSLRLTPLSHPLPQPSDSTFCL